MLVFGPIYYYPTSALVTVGTKSSFVFIRTLGPVIWGGTFWNSIWGSAGKAKSISIAHLLYLHFQFIAHLSIFWPPLFPWCPLCVPQRSAGHRGNKRTFKNPSLSEQSFEAAVWVDRGRYPKSKERIMWSRLIVYLKKRAISIVRFAPEGTRNRPNETLLRLSTRRFFVCLCEPRIPSCQWQSHREPTKSWSGVPSSLALEKSAYIFSPAMTAPVESRKCKSKNLQINRRKGIEAKILSGWIEPLYLFLNTSSGITSQFSKST